MYLGVSRRSRSRHGRHVMAYFSALDRSHWINPLPDYSWRTTTLLPTPTSPKTTPVLYSMWPRSFIRHTILPTMWEVSLTFDDPFTSLYTGELIFARLLVNTFFPQTATIITSSSCEDPPCNLPYTRDQPLGS